jgi:magnesium-transporting ATPase (P-type)
MLTGDDTTTADSVARVLGIEHVEADVLPDRKATVVKELQNKGSTVDAPQQAQRPWLSRVSWSLPDILDRWSGVTE